MFRTKKFGFVVGFCVFSSRGQGKKILLPIPHRFLRLSLRPQVPHGTLPLDDSAVVAADDALDEHHKNHTFQQFNTNQKTNCKKFRSTARGELAGFLWDGAADGLAYHMDHLQNKHKNN